MTFYGFVVDELGTPLPGVHVEYEVEAYPKDWTFETRGRPNDASRLSAVSDEQGRFEFVAKGCWLRMVDVARDGYRHFWEMDTAGGQPSTYAYRLIAWSDLWFKSDPDHPAVYVMVKDGAREISALPCKGGYEWGGGNRWLRNEPSWPKDPSLKDVVRKRPSSYPTTR
jgi:hypothetical protein